MIAALPMYDFPEVAEETDAFWRALAAALRAAGEPDVPDALTRDRDAHAVWSDPELLFAQICIYPLVHEFADRLEPVATPCYDVPGCDGPRYRSVIVVPARSSARHLDDLRGAVCAMNEPSSHSGANVWRLLLEPRGGPSFFREVKWSGAHRRSLALVAGGACDVAAIDCISFAFLQRIDPATCARVRVLDMTAPAPTPPFVIRRGHPSRRARVTGSLSALGTIAISPIWVHV